METKKVLFEMTPEQASEFEAFKAQKAKKEEIERKKRERVDYKTLVDQQVNEIFPSLIEASKMLSKYKLKVIDSFKTAIRIKGEIFNIKDDQASHTFSNLAFDKRIIVGCYKVDNYRDTLNEGIAIVKEVVLSLIDDEKSRVMANAILKLISKDKKGNIQQSRVKELREMASELNSERLLEGIDLIEESNNPGFSSTFVKAEYKNENGTWVNVPLGMTGV